MQWFVNLSTRGKLFLGFGQMVMLMAVLIGTAYVTVTTIVRMERNLYERDFLIAIDLVEVRNDLNVTRADLLTMVLSGEHSERERSNQDLQERSTRMDHTLEDLLERAVGDSRLLSKIEEIKTIAEASKQTRNREVVPLIYAGKADEAGKLALGIQLERYIRMRDIARTLGEEARERARLAVEQSEQRAEESNQILISVAIAALILAAISTWWLDRLIGVPVKRISTLAERVADGDLTVPLPAEHRTDEVGTLAQVFRKMVENIRQMNQEISAGVNVLASSASEILATTSQVASSAAETATAVNETTATVVEIKQTAQLTSQKARSVLDAAQRSAQTSQAGTKSVEEAAAGMGRIRDQMATIAASVVGLSEQGQAIGEIIATVNDLAEQSNLLAVNAAIEAAKAGEQGKGFAVVAQEVRSLAEQSRQATAQVKGILGDIQKATSGAVMATEQGSKAVEAGVRQSAEAGESIRMLAESISDAAQSATLISVSAQQQQVGMDQVAAAMENIKQASTQNVAGTKQAEVSAQNLHALGGKLQTLMAQFRV